jgi:class II aldolase/adducin N-terminal domain-containing protein
MRADQRLHATDILTAGARGYPAGFIIHSAIHMAQTELVCVMHSHTAASNAVERPLSCPISFAIAIMRAQPG